MKFIKQGIPVKAGTKHAFTLIELLVVISIIGILASLMLPGLARAKAKATRTACSNNTRQLTLAWLMYSQDNGRLPESYFYSLGGGVNSNAWVRGSVDDSYGQVESGVLDSTNLNTLRKGSLFPYALSTSVYQCPADRSVTAGVRRVRSYAINGWMGGRALPGEDDFRVFLREEDIITPSPTKAFVFIDEHERTINDGWFPVDMTGNHGLLESPATRHQNVFPLSFADGHVENWKLSDPRTIACLTVPIPNSPGNADWGRMSTAATASLQ